MVTKYITRREGHSRRSVRPTEPPLCGDSKISCVRIVFVLGRFFTTFSIDCNHAVSTENVLWIVSVSPIIYEFTVTSLFYSPSIRLCSRRFCSGDLFGTPELCTFFTVPGDMYRAKYSGYEYEVPRRVSASSGFVPFSFFSLRVEENSIGSLLFWKRDRAI